MSKLLNKLQEFCLGLPEVVEYQGSPEFAYECECGAFYSLMHVGLLGNFEYGPCYGKVITRFCPMCSRNSDRYAKKVTGRWTYRKTSKPFRNDEICKLKFTKVCDA